MIAQHNQTIIEIKTQMGMLLINKWQHTPGPAFSSLEEQGYTWGSCNSQNLFANRKYLCNCTSLQLDKLVFKVTLSSLIKIIKNNNDDAEYKKM